MHSSHSWLILSSPLDPPAVRSLSVQFILQEVIHLHDSKKDQIHLDKLCFYCTILLQASHVDDREMQMILKDLTQKSVLELYADLRGQFRRFFSAFLPYLQEARADENVLVYLIEHKDSLNTCLGHRYIEEMLRSFFPLGHAQLRAVIVEGYNRRGFSTFLSTVEPLIDAIEWETLYHTH